MTFDELVGFLNDRGLHILAEALERVQELEAERLLVNHNRDRAAVEGARTDSKRVVAQSVWTYLSGPASARDILPWDLIIRPYEGVAKAVAEILAIDGCHVVNHVLVARPSVRT